MAQDGDSAPKDLTSVSEIARTYSAAGAEDVSVVATEGEGGEPGLVSPDPFAAPFPMESEPPLTEFEATAPQPEAEPVLVLPDTGEPGFDPSASDPEGAAGNEGPALTSAGAAHPVESLPSEEPTLAPPAPPTPLDHVRDYAERVPIGNPSVAASFPFSLRITGRLTPEEREKLVDLLNRENFGVREMELETQFEEGRVLIPRISEYAGVLVVQALRGAAVDMRLAPSDAIFATDDTRGEAPLPTATGVQSESRSQEETPAAERLPVTSLGAIPSIPHFVVIDVVTASAALNTRTVEAQRSTEYQERLEALTREIKYKAYRKGASAILNFSVDLAQLSAPTHYRLTVIGSAVRAVDRENESVPSA